MIAVTDPHPCIIDPEGRFTGLPIEVNYIDGAQWRIASDVSYEVHEGPLAGYTSTVREGFKTDFASVPRMFWRIFPPAGLHGQPYGLPAVFHDWLYEHQRIQGIPIRRETADRLFLEIMLYVGIARPRARVMYRAVRIGGWVGWNRHRKELAHPAITDRLDARRMEEICIH